MEKDNNDKINECPVLGMIVRKIHERITYADEQKICKRKQNKHWIDPVRKSHTNKRFGTVPVEKNGQANYEKIHGESSTKYLR